MNPFPLLIREFSVALRHPLTLRLRMAFGAGSMLVAVWALLVSTGAAGPIVFGALVCIAGVLAIFAAIFVASDSICRERREGTLGFLFLTDLRAMDIVLGKFAAAGLVPLYSLLAMFPAFALCQLVGGVPSGLLWRALLALVVTLLFSLALTLYVSSLCEDHRKAYGGATLLLLALNPLWLCAMAFSAGVFLFLIVAILFGALCVLFLKGAAARLEKHWRAEGTAPRAERVRGRQKIAGVLLEELPVAWMMLRRRAESKWRWWGFTAASGVACWTIVANVTHAASAIWLVWILFAVHVGYQFVLMTRTAYSFYADRQNGALELMLGSRLTNEEIFDGFNAFLLRRSAVPVAFLSVIDVFSAVVIWNHDFKMMSALPVGMALGLWITLFGLGWLGVYRSLMMNHPSLAMLATYARLCFVPVVFSLLFLMAPRTDLVKVAEFYVLSSGFLAIFFAMDAKAALKLHGRALLLRPYSEKPPHIENEWSFIDWGEEKPARLCRNR